MGDRTGTVNRNKVFLTNRLREMYGDDFDPVMKMAGNAVNIQKIVDDEVDKYNAIDDPSPSDLQQVFNVLANALTAWEKIAQFTNPKYRAIEFSSELGVKGALLIQSGMSAKDAAAQYQLEVLNAA